MDLVSPATGRNDSPPLVAKIREEVYAWRGQCSRDVLTKKWTDWVDYWAVDFDYESRKEIIKVPRRMGVEGELPGVLKDEASFSISRNAGGDLTPSKTSGRVSARGRIGSSNSRPRLTFTRSPVAAPSP